MFPSHAHPSGPDARQDRSTSRLTVPTWAKPRCIGYTVTTMRRLRADRSSP